MQVGFFDLYLPSNASRQRLAQWPNISSFNDRAHHSIMLPS